jgi:hypothetical protein
MKKIKVLLSTLMIFMLVQPYGKAFENADSTEDGTIVFLIGSHETLVNDKKVEIGTPPLIKNNTTLVPLRFISENFGSIVEWESKTKTIYVEKEGTKIILQIGNKQMVLNDEIVQLPVAPEIIDGNTFIPLRALSEALGKKVFYERGIIVISEKEVSLEQDQVDSLIQKLNSESLRNSLYQINVMNSQGSRYGTVTSSEDATFFMSLSLVNPGKIYKEKDGEITIISDHFATKLFYYDGWIYYIKDQNHLYKMKTDGSNVKKLSNDKIRNFIVYDNWIFYSVRVTNLDGQKLFKMNLDGSNKTQIYEGIFARIFIKDSFIYLNPLKEMANHGSIIKMDLNGQNQTVIDEEDNINSFFLLSGDYLYVVRVTGTFPDSEYTIERMNLDGSNKTPLLKRSVFDWLYLHYVYNGELVIEMNKDNFYTFSEESPDLNDLLKIEFNPLRVRDIYYSNDYFYAVDGPNLYKVNINGGEVIQLLKSQAPKLSD